MDAQANTLAKSRDEDEFGAYHGMHWPTFFIANVANRHTRNMTNNLRQFGLIPPMWRVLSFLWDHEELSIGHLADVCGIERTNLSKVVDRMTSEGLVARVSDPRDGRTTIVRMTGEGEALFRRAAPTVIDYLGESVSGFSENEVAEFIGYLKRIQANLNNVAGTASR